MDLKIILALALLGLLLLGCTQAGSQGIGGTGKAPLTSADVGAIENASSEDLDTGLPLESLN